MKIVTIVGARPQFIKAAVVSREIAKYDSIKEIIIHTGQHYDENMSNIFFDELNIPIPTYNLGIGGGSHGAMTGKQMEAIESILIKEVPDWVLVYGDTNSTLAAALAAVKIHIPVAHVEAGLRSYNRRMPEEINRILTDHIATKLLAPTDIAMRNLRSEGFDETRLKMVGDVMYDASLFYRRQAKQPVFFPALCIAEGDYILATVHRAENTDDSKRLASIIQGLGQDGRHVILPLHPRTRARLAEFGIVPAPRLHIVDPVGYLEMVWLEANCSVVATDSGGVQKEAFFHEKPCVTMRDETEWVELVEFGCNTLTGAVSSKITEALNNAIWPEGENKLYGLGDAASKVIEALK